MTTVASNAGTIARRLLAWFKRNGRSFPWRRPGFGEWQLLVTETLLQKTPSERVATVLPGLLADVPGPREMALAPSALLQRHLHPLGLHRTRARSLKSLAGVIAARGCRVPSDYDELCALPGVGPYVASAFLVVAHGEQRATVDANVVRVCRRLRSVRPRRSREPSRGESELATQLVRAAGDARTLSWALLDFGALVCRPRGPLCQSCVLAMACRYGVGRRVET
ncbi:MAG: hypothetical protein IPQ24_11315 [Anaeromyxobacter sp.]|nr:hypothetical protein [Anaeromyxobacter sp.]